MPTDSKPTPLTENSARQILKMSVSIGICMILLCGFNEATRPIAFVCGVAACAIALGILAANWTD